VEIISQPIRRCQSAAISLSDEIAYYSLAAGKNDCESIVLATR